MTARVRSNAASQMYPGNLVRFSMLVKSDTTAVAHAVYPVDGGVGSTWAACHSAVFLEIHIYSSSAWQSLKC